MKLNSEKTTRKIDQIKLTSLCDKLVQSGVLGQTDALSAIKCWKEGDEMPLLALIITAEITSETEQLASQILEFVYAQY